MILELVIGGILGLAITYAATEWSIASRLVGPLEALGAVCALALLVAALPVAIVARLLGWEGM